MSPPTTVVEAGDSTGTPRVAALTMARDEADMLPRWVEYYGGQLGVENLIVLDDNSADGSTDGLACPVLPLPAWQWNQSWAKARRALANGISAGLLSCYDMVLFADVDEFLVPDPNRYQGLLDYLAANRDNDVIAPLALNVLHDPDSEPPVDPSRPVLAQRRFVKFAPGMCKPMVKRVPAEWRFAFHGIRSPFTVDRDLLMLHLKYYDRGAMQTVARQRRDVHDTLGRGHGGSAWPLGPDELASRLGVWVQTPDGQEIPEFDPGEVDLSDVVLKQIKGFFRTFGPQLEAMEQNPVRRIPARFSEAF